MQTRDEPAANAEGTNFGTGSNQTIGLDATFGFFRNLSVNTFVAKTITDGRSCAASLVAHGGYYESERTTITLSRSRPRLTPQLAIEPSLSLNMVDLPTGSFTAKVIGARATCARTPLMFASAFVQYGSANHGLSANLRMRWEYRPGSELFVVYNEERDTQLAFANAGRTRSLILKVNRLFRP